MAKRGNMGKNKSNGEKSIVHLALILDGNRRWAMQNKLAIFSGHEKGAEVLNNIVDFCLKEKIKFLTIYALSSKNIKSRSKEEIAFHFSLHKKYLQRELDSGKYKKQGIRFNALGRIQSLPKDEQDVLKEAMKKSKNFNSLIFSTCIAYDGQEEIVDAVKNIISKKMPVESINEDLIKKNLYTAEIPPPDLIIRTGMFPEQRLSGFLLWDSSYSELHFTKTLWPDFTIEELGSILNNYLKRERRNGC